METRDLQLKAAAVETIVRLLRRRLERAGLYLGPDAHYFRCEAEAPAPFPGGTAVRVRVWHHWSDAAVEHDAADGRVVRWVVNRLADPPNAEELSLAEATTLAHRAIEIPPDAEVSSFHHFEFAKGHTLARLEWRHRRGGIRVDGDYLWVVLHPRTQRVVEWAKRWREVRLVG